MNNTTRQADRDGFTLIELLVVISIIALLVGILLPALGAARRTAQGAVCLSNLRQLGVGIATYGTDSGDYLPGPNTSGAALTRDDASYVFHNSPSEPTQNFDWISPIMGNALGLPADRSERVDAIFNKEFRCPSNEATYDGVFSAGTLNVNVGSPISSYSINANLVVRWDPGTPSEIYQYSWVKSAVQGPNGARYRIDEMAHGPSGKVIALDGARYYDYGSKEVTFNGAVKQVGGGNWGVLGPGIGKLVNNGEPYKFANQEQQDAAKRLAYRHGNTSLNTAFLDGHAASQSEPDSRKVDLWFPSGSIVRNANATDDPDDSYLYVVD